MGGYVSNRTGEQPEWSGTPTRRAFRSGPVRSRRVGLMPGPVAALDFLETRHARGKVVPVP